MTEPSNRAEAGTEAGDINTGGDTSQTIPPKEATKSFIERFAIVSIVIAIGLIPAMLLAAGKITLEGFKDIVLTLGSVFGGPLGIILNNYFKEGAEK